jgi:hypothetical protein
MAPRKKRSAPTQIDELSPGEIENHLHGVAVAEINASTAMTPSANRCYRARRWTARRGQLVYDLHADSVRNAIAAANHMPSALSQAIPVAMIALSSAQNYWRASYNAMM